MASTAHGEARMPVIRARVLGVPELWIDGSAPPAPLRWRKHFGLCLLLWNSPYRRVSRESALAMLWGDRGEREARHSLNEALRVMRKALGPDAIDTTGDRVQWLAPIALDSELFEAKEHQEPLAAATLIDGNWCEGFSVPDSTEFERWLDDERRRWRHRLVGVLVAASERAGDSGNLATARRHANLAHRLDPLNELAARALIRQHALAGDRTAAVTEADAFTARLRDELGVGPGSETLHLLRRVSEMPHRRPVAEPGTRPPDVPLTGRTAEMDRLIAALRLAHRRSTPALLVIDGEPGAGRTRMLDEVVLRAVLEGFAALIVRAVPSDAGRPGAGLDAIAGSGLAALPGAAALGADSLASLIGASPAWAERFTSTSAPAVVPIEEALIAALRAVGAEQPILLAIDDVDALDVETLQQLPRILRDLNALPVVMMVTMPQGDSRPELDALRKYVDRPERGALVRVQPLGHADLLDAIAAVLPGWTSEAQERLTRRLFAESAGVPAVAVAVLEAVMRGLSLDDLDSAWPTAGRTLDATLPSPLPDAWTAAVRLRFHQLGEIERGLLMLLAVDGATIRAERLGRVLEHDQVVVDRHLDALEWERWLVADARGYRYRAKAVGTLVAAELLTSGQRQRLQERLAAN
jgi:DNA-binding SARP family transcriptional activator